MGKFFEDKYVGYHTFGLINDFNVIALGNNEPLDDELEELIDPNLKIADSNTNSELINSLIQLEIIPKGSTEIYYRDVMNITELPEDNSWVPSNFTEFLYFTGITEIPKNYFQDTSLLSIVIPNSVTTIGARAFYDCSSLTDIVVPNSVYAIGIDAFYGTAWYNNLPNGLIYAGKVAYKYKGALPQNTTITLLKGTLGIAGGCFLNKGDSLVSINFSNSLIYIGERAFMNCYGLKTVSIPNSVCFMEERAFSCTGLTNISFGRSLTSISNLVFEGCNSLLSVTIPSNITKIGDFSFNMCESLLTINVHDNLAEIGKSAFGSTLWIDSQEEGVVYVGKVAYTYSGFMPQNARISLREDTIGIAATAFDSQLNLTTVSVPSSVRNIGYGAFSFCDNLAVVQMLPTVPPVLTPTATGLYTLFTESPCTIVVPTESLSTYQSAEGWSDYSSIITDTIA